MRALALFLWIFAVITIISAAQSESDPREVVQAGEILEKIERGEPVNYDHKIIEGDINIGNLKLPEVRRSPDEIEYLGLLNSLKVVRSPLVLDGCLIKGDLNFSNARILGPASFAGSIVITEANFRGSQFDQSVDFSMSRFNKSAYFRRSQFNQSANFKGSRFNQSVDFSMSRFNQSVDFSWSQFNQLADFGKSQFNQSVDFSMSRFNQFANFEGSRFNQSVDFSWSRFNQSVDFERSQFNRHADFRLSRFKRFADFTGSQFQKDALFGRSYLKSADFNQTTFSGDISFEGSQIDSLNLTRAEFGKIFFRWKSIGHLAYDETAYLLLMGNFKNLNFLDDANECYYDYRNDRRATLSWYYRPVDYALMLFYGYGVKPDRPVLWSLIFMAFFAALFWWRQGILPVREGEPEEEANCFSLLEAVAFSAMTFLSGGKLVFDPPEYRIASGRPWRDVQISKALFILERLLGMVLIIMFAIAVGKTIILGGG